MVAVLTLMMSVAWLVLQEDNVETDNTALNNGSLREGFLTSDDEVWSPFLENYPGRGLNPQPVSCFGQQPEEREATVSCRHH